jgi:EAL domain-containing protein (putative c-di-GMP-specific phosphodiesterase class I)
MSTAYALCWVAYNMPARSKNPALSAADLARALVDNDLVLAYQPKVALDSGNLVGVEVLVRWQHSTHGIIGPVEFIPLAENTGLIQPLTEWVIAAAAYDWMIWNDQGLTTNIAVNVSAKNLNRLEFPDIVVAICDRHGMPCSHLTVELTESASQGVLELLDTLTRCRIKEMKLSLDDFGTGYSSLVQLQKLPFSDLKIDRSFVIGAATSRDNRIIVRAVIDLAHNLGLQATAEGVETETARTMLRDFGCDAAQGYLFGKAMPAPNLLEWARRNAAGGLTLAAT